MTHLVESPVYDSGTVLTLPCRWAHSAGVLDYTRQERLVSDKYTSLLRPFVSCEENEVSSIWLADCSYFSGVVPSLSAICHYA
jgi:hypothetical protein